MDINLLKNTSTAWTLITGASSGIGKEFAYQFAALGKNLILIARRETLLYKIKLELESKYKISVFFFPIDLTNDSLRLELYNTIKNVNIEILINNVGATYLGEFSKISEKEISDQLKLNCIVPTELTNLVLPKMLERDKGKIIFVGSILGLIPVPNASIYSASKAYINFISDTISHEIKNSNVNILIVNPGSTNTDFKRIGKGNKLFLREPSHVVESVRKALGKKQSIIDGRFNKWILLLKYLPKKMVLKALDFIVKKELKKNEKII